MNLDEYNSKYRKYIDYIDKYRGEANALNAIYEEVCEGLYSPLDHNPTRDWFEYDEETDSYNRIEEPSYLERYCNFTIG